MNTQASHIVVHTAIRHDPSRQGRRAGPSQPPSAPREDAVWRVAACWGQARAQDACAWRSTLRTRNRGHTHRVAALVAADDVARALDVQALKGVSQPVQLR